MQQALIQSGKICCIRSEYDFFEILWIFPGFHKGNDSSFNATVSVSTEGRYGRDILFRTS